MGFSRQEYWSGLSCPLSGYLPNPGIEFTSLISPALAGTFFTTSALGNHSWFCQSHLSFIHSSVYRSPITHQALGWALGVQQWTCPLVLCMGSGDICLSWGALEYDSQIRNCKQTFHWEELLWDTSKGREDDRIGQREKLDIQASWNEASADPTQGSGALTTLQCFPELKSLYPPSANPLVDA